jgi:ABC-type dipeptide/oligopeptide/nickel transport system permease subunit
VLSAVFAMLIGVLAAFVGGTAVSNSPLQYLTNLFPAAGALIFWVLMIFGFGGASGRCDAFLTAHAAVSGRTVPSRRIRESGLFS